MRTLGYATLKILKGADGYPGFLHNIDSTLVPEIGDIRGDLLALKVNYNEEPIVKIIKVSERGSFIIVYKFYNSEKDNIRDNDGLSVWIYVPNEVNLNNGTLYHVVNDVEQTLSTSGIKEPEVNNQLERLFDNIKYESPSRPSINPRVKQTGNAYRYFDKRHNEYDIFGDLYQDYYCKYNLVFLLKEGDQSVRLSNPDVLDNLTNNRLESYTTLNVPDVAPEIDVYLGEHKNRRFRDSLRARRDDKFTLTFCRSGFDDIQITDNVDNLNSRANDLQWEKTIKKEQFRIYDIDTKSRINDEFNLRILGKLVSQDIKIKEADLNIWKDDVQVQLSQFDIIDDETTVEEKYSGSEYRIWVKRKINEYQFNVSGEDTTITVKTSKRLKNIDHLPAYRIDWYRKLLTEIPPQKEISKPKPHSGNSGKGNNAKPIEIPPYNRPQYVDQPKVKSPSPVVKLLKKYWKPFAFSLVVLCVCIGLFKYCSTHKVPDTLFGKHEVEQADTLDSLDNFPAAAYLETHEDWNRDSLDKRCDGLWDCINRSDHKTISEKYHETYEQSSKLQTLVGLMEQLDGGYTHCLKGDFNINYQSLFDNLKKKVNAKSEHEGMSEESASFDNSNDLNDTKTSNIKNKGKADNTKEASEAKGKEKGSGSDTDNSNDLSL